MLERPYELRRLTDAEVKSLNTALQVAGQMARSSRPLTAADVQGLYDGVLQRRATNEEINIVIGLAFGALIVDGKEFEWVRLCDERGEETGIGVVGKALHAAPISMIKTKLSRGERVNVVELKDSTVRLLRERKSQVADRH